MVLKELLRAASPNCWPVPGQILWVAGELSPGSCGLSLGMVSHRALCTSEVPRSYLMCPGSSILIQAGGC